MYILTETGHVQTQALCFHITLSCASFSEWYMILRPTPAETVLVSISVFVVLVIPQWWSILMNHRVWLVSTFKAQSFVSLFAMIHTIVTMQQYHCGTVDNLNVYHLKCYSVWSWIGSVYRFNNSRYLYYTHILPL